MAEVPAEHPLDQVSPNPYLALRALSGWVTLDDHLIFVQWDVTRAESISSGHKELCERVSAEAALMKGQTQVSIRNKIHTESTEVQNQKRYTVTYEHHITARFPALGRRAHIYIGPDYEKGYRRMKIWRRQGKPAVVLC